MSEGALEEKVVHAGSRDTPLRYARGINSSTFSQISFVSTIHGVPLPSCVTNMGLTFIPRLLHT